MNRALAALLLCGCVNTPRPAVVPMQTAPAARIAAAPGEFVYQQEVGYQTPTSVVARFWYAGSGHDDCLPVPTGSKRVWIRYAGTGRPPKLFVMVGYVGLYGGAKVGDPMKDVGYYEYAGDVIADVQGDDQLCIKAPAGASYQVRFEH